MDTDTNALIKWELISPPDQDVQFLKVVKHEWESDPRVGTGSTYLTTDGWRPFSGYQVLDAEAIPHVSGYELAVGDDWWRPVLVEALISQGVTPPDDLRRSGRADRVR